MAKGITELVDGFKFLHPKAYERIYNKAIDDFVNKLKSECRTHYVDCDPYFGGIEDSILYEDDIDEVAEQLKGRWRE